MVIKLVEYTFDHTVERDLLPDFVNATATEVVDNVSGNITTRVINTSGSGLPTKITFHQKTALLTVDYVETGNLTSMEGMFYGCCNLTRVNTSNFNTSQVTTLFNLFSGCSAIQALDLSSWDTTNVTDMSFLFDGCNQLTLLDLSRFNTQNVKTMQGMFRNCQSLTTLDISNFNLSTVTNTVSLLDQTPQLSEIGLLYASATTINIIASVIPGSIPRKLYYSDADETSFVLYPTIDYIKYQTNAVAPLTKVSLRRIGDVYDTLNLTTGEFTQKISQQSTLGHNGIKYVLEEETNTHIRIMLKFFTLDHHPAQNEYECIIHSFKYIKWKDMLADIRPYENQEFSSLSSGGTLLVSILKSRLSSADVDGFEQWLSQNPITIQYKLAKPIISYLDLTSIDQSNEPTKPLSTFNGETHITTEVSDSTLHPILSDTSDVSYPVVIKPSTRYTIFVTLHANGHPASSIYFNLGGAEGVISSMFTTHIPITTPSILTNERLTLRGHGNSISRIMVLEGDYQETAIEFFEGIRETEAPSVITVNAPIIFGKGCGLS